ncbi:type III restriction endonuclease subunit R [Apilactobacillus kunkeei]|uniref:Type III restriction endonuclease subunit R n=1 Tax=Apilactobacillus kunkeei TaxID=148814 RepID=A0AAC8WCE7_9LACO|nr:type III restriction-modification system endonuclease [Apilactobacillus kunkeei]ALJ31640.1 type III restriction endonuclease subunit R [Apilactobacillus kunkeei]KFJ15241.1 type III restriction-modification system StyLTI enzyme res [Apilactobacillus kunkeei]
MKIQLEKLPHQVRANKAIMDSFYGIDYASKSPDANYIYSNPLLKYRYEDKANIDVKMETGTGKTFVYTQMMYEMHKQGIFKFVIVVPTPSIKAGAKSFLTSDYAKNYFSTLSGYENVSIQVDDINAGDFRSKNNGRKNFPPNLSEFVEATSQNKNQIQVLLINSGMLSKNSGIFKDDYDQTLLGGETSPIKAVAATRPVVIIDEPHRFPRNKTSYKSILQMKPQLIVRFGATFPETTKGRGKNKETIHDYYRGKPQFELNSIDSFNQGLIKEIDINYPDIPEQDAKDIFKVKSVKSSEVVFSQNGKEYVLNKNDFLSDLSSKFTGSISYVGGTNKELSNGLELSKGMQLIPGTFTQSYQDEVISEAIDRHFAAEENNFLREDTDGLAPKIKTLSLFFIDSKESLRGNDDEEKGWLAKSFEKLLTQKLEKLIKKYKLSIDDREKEYQSFLKATLHDLKSDNQKVYAGYFSEERGSGEEAIQEEVNDILNSKERLLNFKDKDGNWITRRFLFSKWTLREGWDNPNIFVIAKLRTSGSENSKIQEVGRGLRLPVDETGHRLQQSEYESRLSFLIGYDEKEFAKKLVDEVNSDSPVVLNNEKLTQEMIDLIVKQKQRNDQSFNEEKLLSDLDSRGIINRLNEFKEDVELDGKKISGYEALLSIYPEINEKTSVQSGKIRDKGSRVSTRVKLNKENWNQLKDLWKQLSKKKMISFDEDVNGIAESIANDVFKDTEKNIFVLQKPEVINQSIEMNKEQTSTFVNETKSDFNNSYITMKYGEFLKQLTLGTDLPLIIINRNMIEAIERLGNDTNYINERTLSNIIKEFNRRFNNRVRNSYSYVPLDFKSSTSIYNDKDDEFVDEVSANDIGMFSNDALEDDKYLYDTPPIRYDSNNPELDILRRKYSDKVTVYGKLPKRSVKIPRYDNGTTTPDFIFKIQKNDDVKYLVVETKADNMRIGDETIKSIQEKYFNELKESGVYYRMATSENEVHDLIIQIENGEI